MSAAPLDLNSLNAAERDALALLAEGHTVKSIAVLTGRSEASVNERLRDARRKTGIGSSRELARLLRRQENRDEQIGVAAADAMDRDQAGPAGGRHRRLAKVLLMVVILAAAVALALGISTELSPQTALPPADPLIESVIGPPGTTPQAMRRRFAVESRDPAWAARSEAALTSAYRKIGGLAPDLRIRCARTLCEVAGRSATGDETALDRTMQALQGKTLVATLASNGLYLSSASFGGSGKTSFAFVAYWSSIKP